MMEDNQTNSPLHKRQDKANKKNDAQLLFDILYQKPISRRMAATSLGYIDLTYMVTQPVVDLIKAGKAQVVGVIRCVRSGRMVEAVTTNPKFFKKRIKRQLEIFSQ
jgi:hypothetical protein